MNREQSEERYRALLSSIDQGFCVVEMLFDDDGRPADYRFLEVNEAFERQTGLTGAAGKRIRELAPDHERHWFETYGRVALTGEPARFENEAKALGGRWFAVNAFRLGPPERRHVGIVFTDITERRRADEARRMSEFRFARLVEQSPLSTQIFAPDGTVRRVNRAWETLWGVTLADLPGYNILHDEQLAARGILPLIRRAFAGEPVAVDPIPYVPDRGKYAGQARWCGAYVYPVKDDASRVEEVVLVHDDVTERRQALEAVREREQRLRSLVEQSAAGIAQTDLTGRIQFANERFCQIVGYPMDELLGLRVHDVTHPEDLAETTQQVADSAATGQEYTLEKRYVRRDGSIVWVAVSASILKDEAGKPQSILGVVIDISDRKRAEDQLRRNHQTFYHLIQNNPFGIYVVDADFRLRQVSLGSQKVFQNVRPLLGRDFAEVLREIWAEPFASQAIALFRHTLETGEPYSSPRTVERRQDIAEVEAYDWRIERITLPDGRFGVVCYFYDLSERQRWEAALRESEARLRLAVDIGEIGTFEINLLNDEVTVNETGRAIYGWRAGERLTFANVQTHFHADDREPVLRQVEAAFDPNGPGEFEVEQRIVRTDGAVRWIRVRGRAVFQDVAGERRAVQCNGTYIDITDEREAEQQREQLLLAERAARAAAEQASEAKSDFLATLSHELRTPLTPVLLTVSLIESHPGLPEELRDDVSTIRRNVELESRLISDLLDLTRITKGKLQLDEQDVDLHLVLRSAIDICQREASAKLSVDLRAARRVVRGDSTRLSQIFWNLINNAMKFTPPQGTITVRSSDAPGGRVRVEVADTGAGIDPAVLPRLFSAFEQGETRAGRQQAGLGLGLAISKKLAEAHGGTITAASRGRGRGATFTVELPVTETYAAPGASARPAQPQANGRALHVLLIEDHEPTLRVLERLLRQIGHRVMGVTTVASATAAAAQDGFDVIISDLGLPDGSGLDVMRQLRERYTGRAIALTGYGMESDVAASREAGFAEHLTKPVDLAALDAAIRRVSSSAE